MRRATAELAALVGHADLCAKTLEPVADRERPPPLELHHRLVRAEPGERIAFEQRLVLGRCRLGRGVFTHRVQERGWRDQTAPSRAGRVGGVAVQRVVVAIAEGEVAKTVTRDLLVVGRGVDGLRYAD